jgi:hypothetical protein
MVIICGDSKTIRPPMDYWHQSFKYPITPKSGPMPRMFTLLDAKAALREIPHAYLTRPHWLRAKQSLLRASQTGRLIDTQWAFDVLVAAIDEERWFDWTGVECSAVQPVLDSELAEVDEA